MKNHRVITFAGAGSAMAAMIAIAAVLLVPTSRGTVGASTIFASLQDVVNNAFRMTYEDLGHPSARGIRVDGEVVVVFDGAVGGASDSGQDASALYFDARVRADEDASELSGLDCEARGAFASDKMWVYFRAGEIPEALVEDNPVVGMYLNAYKNGLLLDLTALVKVVAEYDWKSVAVSAGDGAVAVETQHEALEALGEAKIHLPHGAAAVQMSTDQEVNELFTDLLTGKASPGDFDRLAALIEESAGDVTVTTQPDGSYLLRAVDFVIDNAELGPELEGFLEDMTLEIAYAEESGMLWAAVKGLGPYDGTVRFEQAEVTLDDPMFSDQQYREDGVTTVLDMSMLSGMLGTALDQSPAQPEM